MQPYYVCTIGWRDLAPFASFESGHFAADQVYLLDFNSKKSASLDMSGKVLFFKNQKRISVLKI